MTNKFLLALAAYIAAGLLLGVFLQDPTSSHLLGMLMGYLAAFAEMRIAIVDKRARQSDKWAVAAIEKCDGTAKEYAETLRAVKAALEANSLDPLHELFRRAGK